MHCSYRAGLGQMGMNSPMPAVIARPGFTHVHEDVPDHHCKHVTVVICEGHSRHRARSKVQKARRAVEHPPKFRKQVAADVLLAQMQP